MRLTLPLLKPISNPKLKVPRTTSQKTQSQLPLPSSLAEQKVPEPQLPDPYSAFPFLHSLKSAQLQALARKTGLPTTGLKAGIVKSLEGGLADYKREVSILPRDGRERGNEGMRILSIDMGIRNLAFACLVVPGSLSAGGPRLGRAAKGRGGDEKVELTTWRRISLPLDRGFSVQEFGRYLDESLASTSPLSPLSSDDTNADKDLKIGPRPRKKNAEEKEKTEKESFSLQVYATHAHSIISTLLARYNPTHVLIERQRFRSGGAAAVQEWTLRVGVFEGMIWAVLYSLSQQKPPPPEVQGRGVENEKGRGKGLGSGPRVIAIEPARVGRFWATSSDTNSGSEPGSEKKKKRKISSRENKKLKIDLVGSWLSDEAFSVGKSASEWVDGYVRKWKQSSRTISGSRSKSKSKGESEAGLVDVGKLDDLADCLVQGMTWLEWEGMKGQIVRDGIEAARGVS
ncbi:mitochondrial resolvase Ydc2 [Aspergillus crustosus]